MKAHKILFLVLLVQILVFCIACGSSEGDAALPETAAQSLSPDNTEAAIEEDAPVEEAAPAGTPAENVIGTFEGLEDNHTAIFSFDGAETAFYFEDPAVQDLLFGAIIGSSYTLSYDYSDTLRYVIYQISE